MATNDLEILMRELIRVLDKPPGKKGIVEAFQSAFEDLTGGADVEVEVEVEVEPPTSSSDEPDVVVLNGGRSAHDPVSKAEEPELTVVEGQAGGDVRVEVGRRRRALGSEGRIRVADEVQVVFAGVSPRWYRVHCSHGTFTVLAEDAELGVIRSGQSMDVETRFLRVRGTGRGTYRPV